MATDRQAGLRPIRLHDLRHTQASLLLKGGVPVKVVSERLGHADPGFTMRVYQHVMPGMQAAAAKLFAGLVDRERALLPSPAETSLPTLETDVSTDSVSTAVSTVPGETGASGAGFGDQFGTKNQEWTT